ncbi:MAG: hypothetical protein L6Q98_19850 [Anaerolineae bacterium]|nr:hypothetical protein [Anaerolineae bacterium]
MSDWCAVWIAYGDRWRTLASASAESFRRHHPGVQTVIIAEAGVEGFDDVRVHPRAGMTHVQASRWAKVNLDAIGLPERVLYLDADTVVQGALMAYIDPLREGFDLAITASLNQGTSLLRHVTTPEREETLREVGFGGVQWQAGAFAFRHSPAARALFAAWREEWTRWRGADQGALMRALRRTPVRLWALGRDFNGGNIVGHRSAGG